MRGLKINKQVGRDTPLSETPEPKKIDNTYVKKQNSNKEIAEYKKRESFKPDYRYVDTYEGEGTATAKDSADYKKGFYKQQSNQSRGKGTTQIGMFNARAGYGAQEYKDRTGTRDKKRK